MSKKVKIDNFGNFLHFCPEIMISSIKIMPSDGLSELNGILYIFHDSIAIKDPFSGGNVGKKTVKIYHFGHFLHF